MNFVQRVEHWGDTHHPQWLDIVRIGLGAFLCFKGIQFLGNMSGMLTLMNAKMSFGSFTAVLMSNYIAFAHVLGGILLILGVLTRFACLLQIPILLGLFSLSIFHRTCTGPYPSWHFPSSYFSCWFFSWSWAMVHGCCSGFRRRRKNDF